MNWKCSCGEVNLGIEKSCRKCSRFFSEEFVSEEMIPKTLSESERVETGSKEPNLLEKVIVISIVCLIFCLGFDGYFGRKSERYNDFMRQVSGVVDDIGESIAKLSPGYKEKKMKRACIANMRTLESALEMYLLESEALPSSTYKLTSYFAGCRMPKCPNDKLEYQVRQLPDNKCFTELVVYCKNHNTVCGVDPTDRKRETLMDHISGCIIDSNSVYFPNTSEVYEAAKTSMDYNMPDENGMTPMIFCQKAGLTDLFEILKSRESSEGR